MLVTRQCESEQSHWSSKYETIFHKSTSPRMSNFDSSLSTQPEWQGHYSFLPPGETNIFAQPFEQVSGPSSSNDMSAQQRPASANTSNNNNTHESSTQPRQSNVESPMSHSRDLDPLGLRARKAESPRQEQAEQQSGSYAIKTEATNEDSLSATSGPGLPLGQNALEQPTSRPSQDVSQSQGGNEDSAELGKEDDDVVLSDDDMVEGDGDSSIPQTAAERAAAKRKMKRFRLTHQQTRFLMSEFAKQPHPDAAHRERLSREIPGLSPRQVQVWFQNRRAKIKRMTADDRDRMIKMRAVPDDFDNVQALHSPYGAVHTLATPISSPMDFGNPSYAEHMMRPLMVDTMRRNEGEDSMSSTGLSPGFGGIGFTPSAGSMSNPDILSPMSASYNDRSGYSSSHLTSPLSSGSRTSNPFARQGSMDTGMMQSRQGIRPLQPLQLRETMSRSRSDLQSPLRSSMSWKGDSIDYTYQGQSGSPGVGGRHPSVYQPDQMSSAPNSGLSYDSNAYSGGAGVQTSPTQMNYSTLQQPPPSRSRLRAASATLPLGLDLRTGSQYRSISSATLQPSSQHSSVPRASSTTPYGSSPVYTSSFPSAPLTAPVDFSLPRTPGIRSSVPDYSVPQMSAPIAPPTDFSRALQASLSPTSTRTPIRDSFSGVGSGQTQISGERTDEYGSLKRKRSFSMSQSGHTPVSAPPSQPYGHTS